MDGGLLHIPLALTSLLPNFRTGLRPSNSVTGGEKRAVLKYARRLTYTLCDNDRRGTLMVRKRS